jgi:hypothetical protein
MGTKNLYVNKKLASVEQIMITKGQKGLLHDGNKTTCCLPTRWDSKRRVIQDA